MEHWWFINQWKIFLILLNFKDYKTGKNLFWMMMGLFYQQKQLNY